MKRTIVRMRQCLLIVAMWLVAVPATATNEPGNYQFYSTSALSGSPSSITHSHLGQNGSVRVTNTSYYIQDYQQMSSRVAGRVYSASAFHTPTVYTTTSGGAIAVGAGSGTTTTTHNQGNSLNATVVKVSMPALATHEKNADALASAAQADDESQVQVRRVRPVTPEDDPTPVGDAMLPLMLMALTFVGVIYTRRKRLATKC